jgi:hypothetical protein
MAPVVWSYPAASLRTDLGATKVIHVPLGHPLSTQPRSSTNTSRWPIALVRFLVHSTARQEIHKPARPVGGSQRQRHGASSTVAANYLSLVRKHNYSSFQVCLNQTWRKDRSQLTHSMFNHQVDGSPKSASEN